LKDESEIQSVISDVLKNINYHLSMDNELMMRYFLKSICANYNI